LALDARTRLILGLDDAAQLSERKGDIDDQLAAGELAVILEELALLDVHELVHAIAVVHEGPDPLDRRSDREGRLKARQRMFGNGGFLDHDRGWVARNGIRGAQAEPTRHYG
jgi:hypothetical protein